MDKKQAKELAEIFVKRSQYEFDAIAAEFKRQADYINRLEVRIESLETHGKASKIKKD